MKFLLQFVIAAVAWVYVNACDHYGDSKCLEIKPIEGRHFLNQWIVEIHGGEETAKIVAQETGFSFIKAAHDHENHYFFSHPEVPRRHKMKHKDLHQVLQSHEQVSSCGQQYVWRPTLNQLDEYFEFVGHDEPSEVVISTFNPDERADFYRVLMNTRNIPSYSDDEGTTIEERDFNKNAEKSKSAPVEPLNELFDLDAMYAMKEKMKNEVPFIVKE